MDYKLSKWFLNTLKRVMEHNDYGDCINVEQCESIGNWTPCDLIAREELNNGGGSAKGFLGILPYECHKAYDYMAKNKQKLIDYKLISKSACNNFGFPLWDNYNFDR